MAIRLVNERLPFTFGMFGQDSRASFADLFLINTEEEEEEIGQRQTNVFLLV